MKKLFLFILLTAGINLFAFDAKIVITRALNIEDQFMHILPQRPPFFPILSKIEPQKVNIL